MGEFMLRKLADAKGVPNRETAWTRAEECLFFREKVLRRRRTEAAQQQRFGPSLLRARACLTRRTRSRRDEALTPMPFRWRNSATRAVAALSSASTIRC